ncbi:hypothetical protein BV25DRAFT_1820510 [Artomyces pyxidatus]|uniref:Uncharacterized protein n=1 Tax=Artomyces pyxidatus TaxID=48021 RepID=A0ACB8TDM7_9AGAM|nr:hypothetical protein BV25DRAFT_1820510 [Artomyces pyxidatus]
MRVQLRPCKIRYSTSYLTSLLLLLSRALDDTQCDLTVTKFNGHWGQQSWYLPKHDGILSFGVKHPEGQALRLASENADHLLGIYCTRGRTVENGERRA